MDYINDKLTQLWYYLNEMDFPSQKKFEKLHQIIIIIAAVTIFLSSYYIQDYIFWYWLSFLIILYHLLWDHSNFNNMHFALYIWMALLEKIACEMVTSGLAQKKKKSQLRKQIFQIFKDFLQIELFKKTICKLLQIKKNYIFENYPINQNYLIKNKQQNFLKKTKNFIKMDLDQAVNAQVTEIIGKTGSRGQISQVKVSVLGKDQRTLIRNVKGPVKVGDTLALMECEREARRLR